MALDARHRSSIYDKLLPLLGEDDCNALMSQYLEAEDVVTKDYLAAELSELRVELSEALRRQQAWTLGAIAASTAIVSTLVSLS